MTRSLPLLLVLFTGCGGSTLRSAAETGAATDAVADAAIDSARAECPNRNNVDGAVAAGVAPGRACPDDSLVCLGDDACNDCYCQSYVWVCETRACIRNPPSCPMMQARSGDPCTTPRTACDYGVGCSGAHCVCAGAAWTCDQVSCADR